MFDLNDMIRWVFETGTITEHEKLAYITMYAVLIARHSTRSIPQNETSEFVPKCHCRCLSFVTIVDLGNPNTQRAIGDAFTNEIEFYTRAVLDKENPENLGVWAQNALNEIDSSAYQTIQQKFYKYAETVSTDAYDMIFKTAEGGDTYLNRLQFGRREFSNVVIYRSTNHITNMLESVNDYIKYRFRETVRQYLK